MPMMDTLRKLLKGAVISAFGRSCDLLWFSFSKDGRAYCLHLQCWTRIFLGDKLLTTSREIYEPAGEDSEDFSWEKFGDSRYDSALQHCEQLKSACFEDMTVTDCGDAEFHFTNGVRMQFLADAQPEEEAWRLFEKGAACHYVYYNSGMLAAE